MSWTEQTQAVASMLSLGVTIFGFLFVTRQIKLVERVLKSDSNGRLSEQSITILTYIANRPHVYDYIYNSKPLALDDEYRVEVACVCEMLANYSDLVVSALPDLEPTVRARWVHFVTDTAASSPAFRDHLNRFRLWYSDELLALI